MTITSKLLSRGSQLSRRLLPVRPTLGTKFISATSTSTSRPLGTFATNNRNGFTNGSVSHQWMAFSTDTKDNTKDEIKEAEIVEETVDEPTPPPTPPPPPKASGPAVEFQAETRQLLDIVTNSLYTDKEVFLRELISNASDACEKLRHLQSTSQGISADDTPLEIRITTDLKNGTLTIADTGVGMTRDELRNNLGTIARSGSKAFVKESSGGDAGQNIIGKFGVGFYSAFMVGTSVDVVSKSAMEKHAAEPAQVWSSEGIGSYQISDLEEDKTTTARGSSLVIQLKDDCLEYADESSIQRILTKYSNYVQFPIYLNDERVNTVEAVWAKEIKSVTEEQHSEFYKFVANAHDEPLSRIHFRADAPLEIKALFYIPSFHGEKYGMGRMESGVSLYSRKVLIESHCPDVLPEWCRFVKGVVDSEDLPLSLSREKSQDSALIRKLKKVLTRKIISHLTTMAKKEPEKYKSEFFNEYSYFLKEGICQDYEFQEQLSKLLLFETSKTLDGELSSLDEYISRCQISQKKIYYLQAPTRQMALDSPYLEAFEKSGKEVLFVYSAIDDFVFSNLTKYDDRELISAEKGGLDLDKETDEKDEDEKKDDKDTNKDDAVTTGLNQTEIDHFCAWLQSDALGSEKIKSIRSTKRLGASPAIIIDHESAAFRRMMKMVESQGGTSNIPPLPKQAMEVNPEHELIVGLNALRESEPELAKVCAEQIYDNCLVAAGLMEDGGRSMLGRLNDILLCVVKKGNEDGNVNAVVEDIADSEDKTSSDGIAVEESDEDEKKDETKEKKDNK